MTWSSVQHGTSEDQEEGEMHGEQARRRRPS